MAVFLWLTAQIVAAPAAQPNVMSVTQSVPYVNSTAVAITLTCRALVTALTAAAPETVFIARMASTTERTALKPSVVNAEDGSSATVAEAKDEEVSLVVRRGMRSRRTPAGRLAVRWMTSQRKLGMSQFKDMAQVVCYLRRPFLGLYGLTTSLSSLTV